MQWRMYTIRHSRCCRKIRLHVCQQCNCITFTWLKNKYHICVLSKVLYSFFYFSFKEKSLHYVQAIIRKTCFASIIHLLYEQCIVDGSALCSVAMCHIISGCASAFRVLSPSVLSIFAILDSFDRKCNLLRNESWTFNAVGNVMMATRNTT